ncbi:membrane protein [Mesorhizobium sp. WSM3626]|uniref:membrane protein n=1 Tax=Mesorhizobium sp. WSM3626 TaxID=1040987 RepID=UPI00047F8801|nr:membrane protein [Mesorhizobium sp. WSM3626]
MLYILALLIGVIAGLRAMTAPAAIAWGAYLGWLPVAGSWASFMSHWAAVGIFTVLAIVELVTDQLPSTPSRKVPQQFGARILLGAFSGAVLGAAGGATIVCLIAGAIGAVIGTLGGAEARGRLAAAFGKDQPAAFIEDAVAIVGGLLIVAAVA